MWTTPFCLNEARHVKDMLGNQGEMKLIDPPNLAIREGLLDPPRQREMERHEQQRRN